MVAVFVISMIAFVIGAGMVIAGKIDIDDDGSKKSVNIRGWGSLPIILGVILLLVSIIRIISPGHVGVQVVFGKVGPTELTEGIHMVSPWTSVKQMSIRTEEYTMSAIIGEGERSEADSIMALSSDGAELEMDITVLYRLDGTVAHTVFQEIGPTYVEKIVRPLVRTAIREATSEYTASQAFSSSRDQLTLSVEGIMQEAVAEYGVIIESVNIRNIKLPERIKNSMDEKLAAEQEAQAMAFVLQKEIAQAEVRVVEAGGLADAQEIIDKSLTPNYLQWKYIESLSALVNSPNNSTIIMPFDQNLIPMLDITGGDSPEPDPDPEP